MISSRAVTSISNLQNLSVLCSAVTFYALKMSTFVGLGFQKKTKKLFFVLRIEKSVRYAIICPFAKLFNYKKYIH